MLRGLLLDQGECLIDPSLPDLTRGWLELLVRGTGWFGCRLTGGASSADAAVVQQPVRTAAPSKMARNGLVGPACI